MMSGLPYTPRLDRLDDVGVRGAHRRRAVAGRRQPRLHRAAVHCVWEIGAKHDAVRTFFVFCFLEGGEEDEEVEWLGEPCMLGA